MTADEVSPAQEQTRDTFSFKWSKSDTYASAQVRDEWRRWLLEKYFDGDPAGPEMFLGSKPLRILDAGCGAGISALLLFGDLLAKHEYVGVDISDAVLEARKNFDKERLPGTFVQADLRQIPNDLGSFELIFSEGVLHHTDSVQESLSHLASRLKPSGRIAFYVYARKAPLREFADDFIREQLSTVSDDEAWRLLMPLTRLGRVLGELELTVQIDEDIELLGIPKGEYDLQRLVYYKVFKAYYRPDFSLEEMNHINFDWYRPANCHRHTPTEVIEFCDTANLDVIRLHHEESGIAVIAKKRHDGV